MLKSCNDFQSFSIGISGAFGFGEKSNQKFEQFAIFTNNKWLAISLEMSAAVCTSERACDYGFSTESFVLFDLMN